MDEGKMLLSGAAFAADSFERASIVAALQATRALVAGELEMPQAGDRQLVARAVGSTGTVSATSPADAPRIPRPATAPDDFVSKVLSRIDATLEVDRTPPPL